MIKVFLFFALCLLLGWFLKSNEHDITCALDELYRSVDYSCSE